MAYYFTFSIFLKISTITIPLPFQKKKINLENLIYSLIVIRAHTDFFFLKFHLTPSSIYFSATNIHKIDKVQSQGT